jgi:hypothetical protein
MEARAAATGGSLTWRGVAGCTVLYAAASLLFCSPFLTLGTLGAGADWGDARLIVWTLAWHARWPLSGEWPLGAPLFAPEPSALVYSEPMIGLGLAAAPITALLGPLVSFDALRLAIPVLLVPEFGQLPTPDDRGDHDGESAEDHQPRQDDRGHREQIFVHEPSASGD